MEKSKWPPQKIGREIKLKIRDSENLKTQKMLKNHGFSFFKIQLLPVNPEKLCFFATFFKIYKKSDFSMSHWQNSKHKTELQTLENHVSPLITAFKVCFEW